MLSTRSPTFKQAHVNSRDLPRLGDIAVIRLQGADAETFAQSQFMNDVAALAVGQWQWNGWLSAKGRVQALFVLARPAPGDLFALLFDQPAGPFVDGLRRFVLRRKVAIAEDGAHGVFAAWPATASPPPRDALLAATDGADAVGLDLSAAGVSRQCWVAPLEGAVVDRAATARWRDDDLRHGLPRFDAGREHGWTPHMLSLDRLKAFSVRKGCYPGQEIVARTHFLGQAKRQAWWLEGRGLADGAAVLDAEGRSLGEVVGATSDGLGALAVAALAGPGGVRCGVGEATAAAPGPGLARPD